MSTALYFRPEAPRRGKRLETGTKFLLRKKFDLSGEGAVLGPDDLAYLEGLADAAAPDVEKDLRALIAAISTHGEIRLWEES